jgi:hypothetical protein
VVRSRKKDPEKTKKLLEKHEGYARLLKNEDFKKLRLEFELMARMEGLNSLRPEKSNFERSMAAGILDFLERRFSAMERQARPEALKKLREGLEDQDGSRVGDKPTGYTGIAGIGEF